jgi:hypothetical protein
MKKDGRFRVTGTARPLSRASWTFARGALARFAADP